MNLIVLTIGFFFISQLSFAESSLERITLFLNGTGCQASVAKIETALNGLDGVRAVDARSIPQHVLVDVARDRLTAGEIADRVTSVGGRETSCRVSVMESCITADQIKFR
jgi:copper chaperone CopZ